MDRAEFTARQGFKYFNHFMLMMWRLGLGKWINFWPQVGGQILIITHTGRKSGLPRRTPVNYAIVEGEIYCVAGFGHVADWYRNMLAHPEIEIWMPDGWWQAVAEEVIDAPNRLALVRAVLIGSGFAAVFGGVDPYTVSDQELDEKTRAYRLVRLRPTAPRTGSGGPGDLAWVWPLATLILLPLALRKRKK